MEASRSVQYGAIRRYVLDNYDIRSACKAGCNTRIVRGDSGVFFLKLARPGFDLLVLNEGAVATRNKNAPCGFVLSVREMDL